MTDKSLYPSTSLHGQVAHQIGREIVSGVHPEGTTLDQESELSKRFSVSRQVVREALKVLGAKGLVATRRRAGTQVRPRKDWKLLDPDVLAWHPPGAWPADFLTDLAELRCVIEPAAAEMAAKRASDEQIARIGEAIEAMRSVELASPEFFEADTRFHLAIFEASGNKLIDQLRGVIGPSMQATFPIHYQGVASELMLEERVVAFVQESVEAHASVYYAIADRNPDEASARMKALLSRISVEVEYFIRHQQGAE